MSAETTSSRIPGRVGPRDILLLSIGAGLATGFLHAAALLLRRWLVGGFTFTARDAAWMAPIAYVLILGGFAIPLAVLTRLSSRAATGRAAVFLLLLVALFAVLQHFTAIHPWALLALATGVAARLTAPVADRLVARRGVVERGVGALALLLTLTAAWTAAVPFLKERRALASPPVAAEGPSILILVLDTVRAASMSLYGYERRTTPNIDRLAQGGAVFEWALASSPWTLPSHASLFTGQWPDRLSARWDARLDQADSTLSEVLGRRGYATGGFTANPWYTSFESGLARGFGHYEEPHRRSFRQVLWSTTLTQMAWVQEAIHARRLPTGLGDPGRWRWVPSAQSFDRKWAPEVAEEFLAWQAGLGGRPFFAFLNFFDAHDPYGPPAPWGAVFAAHPGARDAYDGSIDYIDAAVGRLLGELEGRGALARTIVVITSDHGEQFGEHGLSSHGNSLYLPVLHVPLVILYPPVAPAGARVSEAVSLRDLGATLLDLAGVAAPDWPGRSFAPLVQGAGEAAGTAAPVLAQVEGSPPAEALGKPAEPTARGPMRSAFADRWHYILNGDGREELYDYRADRGELNDVADSPAQAARLVELRALAQDPR